MTGAALILYWAGPIRGAWRKKLDGVLLDVDGTLIDSNEAHARSWSDALKDFGRVVPPEEVRPLIGMGGKQYVPKLRPTRGAKELVRRLKREGLRLIIATSANESELDAMLRQVGLDDLIEQKTPAALRARNPIRTSFKPLWRRRTSCRSPPCSSVTHPTTSKPRRARASLRWRFYAAGGAPTLCAVRSRSTRTRRISSRTSPPAHFRTQRGIL
jgi:hypothetical protein